MVLPLWNLQPLFALYGRIWVFVQGVGMARFVSEVEAEALAKKHIENYINDCHCHDVDDVRRATQKMLAVAMEAFELLHSSDLKTAVVQ